MTGLKSLALRVALAAALGAPFAPGASAQWGWTTPASPSSQTQAPASAPPPQGENFSAGKSGAQLFASDCTGAGCHKGPQGLAKDRGAGSLASFLREHYTNSRQSAAALAAYLVSLPAASRSDPKPQQPRAAARPDDKPAERKPPAAIPSPSAAAPSGETGEPAKPAPKPQQRGRQATAPPAQPAAPSPPAATPAPAAEQPPAPAAAPAAPPEPPKPQWDIFD